ncbi:MAG: T9SS type A sorting domain-containing protein [Aureispira sp.]|nr:T9SS type A sorting domain-containing protein [Aureispira sp.]
MKLSSWFFIGSLVLFACTASAQLQEISLGEHNPVLVEHHEKNAHQQLGRGNTCGTPVTVALPFFDDFAQGVSSSYYPNCTHWQDRQAYVNQSMAYNPPSIGVATLDGLNENGQPYIKGASTALSYPADTLTSQYIDLSGKSSTSKLFLSFFYQPQGLSDRPELIDSLFVDFKRSDSTWQQVFAVPGVAGTVSSLTKIDFEEAFLGVVDTTYLHTQFQFRFRNLATVTGNNDHWHIDYVYLDDNRDTSGTVYYPDVAFTHRPKSPLNHYSAMPWSHFTQSAFSNEVEMRTYNHSSISGTLDRTYTVYDLSTNNASPELLNTPIPALTYGPSPNADDTKIGNFGSFNPLTLAEQTVLSTTYTILNPADFQNNPIFAQNDTVTRLFPLEDYFAYDDNTAETRIIADKIGTQVAVEYTAVVSDTIRGILFHMPHYDSRNSELDYINVKVWVDSLSSDTEMFSRDIYRLRYSPGHNGFHYAELLDFTGSATPVAVQAGQKFYVGWQQASTTPVPVGFDKSTDARQFTYLGVGTSWSQSTIEGAIMIRPVLSTNTNFNIGVEKVQETKVQAHIYPNPTTGLLNIELDNVEIMDDYTLSVHNTIGQQVHQQKLESTIDLGYLNEGMYILSIQAPTGKLVSQHKLLKQ